MFAKLGLDTKEEKKKLKQREQTIIDDFRVIDMYDAAIRRDLKTYKDRTGNWVQKFSSNDDAKLFATAQFGRYRDVENFIQNHFSNPDAIRREVERRESK